jgi:prolyl 4-hydroxylase
MSRPPAEDARPLLQAFEAPEYLRQKCLEMQAEAPDLGLGYQKARLPPHLHERLTAHFRANVESFRPEGAVDEIRTAAPQTIPALVFEDDAFNAQLAEDLRPLHEEWAGMPLVLSHCYGIRCYQRGTFLYNHVDRQPHFVSSTICVDYALDSPWPLCIVGADGQMSQIDTDPGELVFYEGARLAHGRPYPLDGDFYAGIFVHYYPAAALVEAAKK